jgi:hypothetical protein
MLYDSVLDFVSFHYQGERDDTDFWKSIQENNRCTPRAKQYKEKCKNQIPGFLEIHGLLGAPAAALWNWIAAGLDIITPAQAEQELKAKGLFEEGKAEHEKMLSPNAPKAKSYITFV